MQWVRGALKCTVHAFAVDGHDAMHAPGQAGEPVMARVFQRSGVDQAKHPGKRVVGRDSVKEL
jgi:hypothetical protein